MKRFYKDVGVLEHEGGWQVVLDGRGLKTVKGAAQLLPTRALADAAASEWADQGEKLDTTKFVFRDMADYAIDIVAADRSAVASKLLAYAETDTLCYRADPEEPLYARQQEVWEPLLASFEARHGVSFTRVSGIVHRPQSDAALASLRQRVEAETPFVLAALENMASLSASLSIALMASEPDADPEALWHAASLEEEWQAELWGRDHEAEQRRARRQGEFLKARRFAVLARD